MKFTERDAPAHIAVYEGSKEEAKVLDGGGILGGHLQGIQRLWEPPGDSELLLIPGASDLGGRQQLAGGGQKCFIDKGGVEEDDKNPHQGGGGSVGVRLFL